MAKMAGPVFGKIADTLVDAFVGRAEQVYGPADRPGLIAPRYGGSAVK